MIFQIHHIQDREGVARMDVWFIWAYISADKVVRIIIIRWIEFISDMKCGGLIADTVELSEYSDIAEFRRMILDINDSSHGAPAGMEQREVFRF